MMQSLFCQSHGTKLKREACSECNRVYMRYYQRQRRAAKPEVAMIERAKERSRRLDLPFDLTLGDICLPAVCPALGIPIWVGGPRSAHSPSLDRIQPHLGYVAGNVRVVSNQANCLKGDKDIGELKRLALQGPARLRSAYALVVDYVERENLLAQAWNKAAGQGRETEEWANVGRFLEQRFRHFVVEHAVSLATKRYKM